MRLGIGTCGSFSLDELGRTAAESVGYLLQKLGDEELSALWKEAAAHE